MGVRDGNLTLTISAQHGAVTTRSERPVMTVEMLTYAALSERLGCSAEGRNCGRCFGS
jgi:hypothetical protein